MFGFVIGGSGKLYLAVSLPAGEERWMAWRPMYSVAEYRLFGRRGGNFRVLLTAPTSPHPLTRRPSDPPRASDDLAAWRELWELRALVLDTVLGRSVHQLA